MRVQFGWCVHVKFSNVTPKFLIDGMLYLIADIMFLYVICI